MDWKVWVKGLAAAVIGGAANAVTLFIVDPSAFTFADGGKKLLSFVAVNAVVALALYLKQSPLPGGNSNA